MTAQTLAGKLVTAFGDIERMSALYAPEVEWHLPKGLNRPAAVGRDAVLAFNREVWTLHYRPQCRVDVLDEIGNETRSAVRFLYKAHSNAINGPYENEYTVFVRSNPSGITHVFEAMDSVLTLELMTGQKPGSSFARLYESMAAAKADAR